MRAMRAGVRCLVLVGVMVGAAACSDDNNTSPVQPGGGGGGSSCADAMALLAETYPDAGTLGECAGEGARVAASLMAVNGLKIDNNGATLEPCLEVKCDSTYAYIASNNLPHYDYVQTTPNALVAVPSLYRVALSPKRPTDSGGAAVALDTLRACETARTAYLSGQATTTEPSGMCTMQSSAPGLLRETLASGEAAVYAQTACLNGNGVTISGVSMNSPNEAANPDPWGNPMFAMPATASTAFEAGQAILDLCGGHSGGSMHYHGLNEACFTRDADGKPANTYAVAAQQWDIPGTLDGACQQESGILGWSRDGYPIKGPCVCTARDAGGACTTVKRARSAWVYRGLDAWGDEAAPQLGKELASCTTQADCCEGDGACDFRCSDVLISDGAGTQAAKRCALIDYSWCSHHHIDRSATDTAAESFVYMDRCNGFEGADGYAYHATSSFPYFQGCFRGEPQPSSESFGGGQMGGMNNVNMNNGGGMGPPRCTAQQTTMCCGDGICGGPENAQNCADDCGT